VPKAVRIKKEIFSPLLPKLLFPLAALQTAVFSRPTPAQICIELNRFIPDLEIFFRPDEIQKYGVLPRRSTIFSRFNARVKI
jgi:hypothetical protein